MPFYSNDTAETQKSSEIVLRQAQEKHSQQGLSRQCWSEIGATHAADAAPSKSMTASLGLPDLSFFDGSAADTQPHRHDFQTLLKADEQKLKMDVASVKQHSSASPEIVHKLHEVEQELKHAQKYSNPEELKKATQDLAALAKTLRGQGGDGSGGGGTGGEGGSGGDGGTGGDGGSGNGGSGSGGDGGSGSGGSGGDGGSTGVGSTATKFGTDAMTEVSQTAPGFYVSPNGSANGDGSAAHPFATLQQAQKAMQNSDIKTTYVEGGTYKMGSTLNLTSADTGESFVSVGGSTNPAVLDGGGKLSDLISLNGANNVSIEGFSMQNTSNAPVWSTKHGQVDANVGAIFAQNSTGDTFAYNSMNNVNVGINMQGDSNMSVSQNSITNAQSAIDSGSSASNVYGSNNTIQGNLVENITGYGAKLFDNVGAINIYGDTNAKINNNVIENTAGVGIQMNYTKAGSGFTVANNTILNTDYLATTAKPDTSSNPVGDDGAIHVFVGPGSTKMLNGVISNNYINGAGANHADKCVYLDDGVNGVTVSGNVLQEGGAGYAMQIHGGSKNIVDNNTFLLDSNGGGLLYQTDGFQMTGNVIENNDFTATGKGQKAYSFLNTDSSDMPIWLDNIYSPGLNESPDPNGSTN